MLTIISMKALASKLAQNPSPYSGVLLLVGLVQSPAVPAFMRVTIHITNLHLYMYFIKARIHVYLIICSIVLLLELNQDSYWECELGSGSRRAKSMRIRTCQKKGHSHQTLHSYCLQSHSQGNFFLVLLSELGFGL
jgi:hypothetical protein